MWPYGTTDTEGKDTKSFIVPKVSVCLWQRNIINVHDNYLTLKSQKYAWNSFWFSRKKCTIYFRKLSTPNLSI